jgi:ketosteroid isomerase-like protein
MRSIILTALLCVAGLMLGACGAPATNTNTNTNSNANTAKPVAAAPTADALMAMEKQANEAYIKGDGKFFDGMLSDKFVMSEGRHRMSKADVVKTISSNKCDVKDGWTLDKPEMSKIDNDTYVVTYTSNMMGTCTADGHTEKMDKPVRAASVWCRNGDKWQAVFHGENAIIDPKAPPEIGGKGSLKDDAKTDAKKEEPKKDDKMASDSNSGSNSNSASNTAATAAPTADPNTDALTKLHASGWEAFRNKDAKKFEEMTTKDLSFVDPMGGFTSGQSNVIKLWTETMKCEGIIKTSFTEGFASALSPTLEVLTGKGTADGTCDGMKNGDLNQTSFYVKEADAWKLAFMFESAPMSGM